MAEDGFVLSLAHHKSRIPTALTALLLWTMAVPASPAGAQDEPDEDLPF